MRRVSSQRQLYNVAGIIIERGASWYSSRNFSRTWTPGRAGVAEHSLCSSGVAGNCSAASAKVANVPHCRPIFALKHSAVTMSARKHASQWTCRAPARDAGKAKSYQLHGAVPVSTGRFQTLMARRGACWPRKKYAKRRLPIRSTHSQPN